jgi:hypothetical protein
MTDWPALAVGAAVILGTIVVALFAWRMRR